jgi:hypothetical protein
MTLAEDDTDVGFLNSIIAGDETWCFWFDSQPKNQACKWKFRLSWKQKFHLDKDEGKVTLEVSFGAQALAKHELIPEGCSVNKEMYIEIH